MEYQNFYSPSHIVNEPLAAFQTSSGLYSIVDNVFSYLFSKNDLVEKNEYLLQFLNRLIQEQEIQTLKRFMSSLAINDLHVSLLKGILILTDNLEDVNTERTTIENVFQNKMANPQHL